MKGNPKYKVGDIVKFRCADRVLEGEIYIVDSNGTFMDPSNASYDIFVEKDNCLYKHFNENLIIETNETN